MMTDQTNPPTLSANPYTRRQMIAGSAIALCSLAITDAQADAQEAATESAKMKIIIMTRAIHQEEDFKAGPRQIYDALLDARQFSACPGGRAAESHRDVG